MTIQLFRRGFITRAASIMLAPAIVRPESLMRISVQTAEPFWTCMYESGPFIIGNVIDLRKIRYTVSSYGVFDNKLLEYLKENQ